MIVSIFIETRNKQFNVDSFKEHFEFLVPLIMKYFKNLVSFETILYALLITLNCSLFF